MPLIFTYAAGNAAIKYHEGFITYPTLGIIPKPHQLWNPTDKSTIFPLMLLFSVGWSLEMVTHLEELCFWLFLVNAGSAQQNWFQSPYFKTWIVGSAIAVVYMPVVTIVTRSDPLKSEAFTYLAGSLGSLSLTLWFTPILWTFPSFLNNLRVEGVDLETIVRLTKFSELNVCFCTWRNDQGCVPFFFTVPLLILGVDGVRPHVHVNESMFWTDFLIMVAGFGCAISSGITLVIFFPRSIEGEIAATRSFGNSTGVTDGESIHRQVSTYAGRPVSTTGGTYLLTSSPIKQNFSIHNKDSWDDEGRDIPAALPPFKPNRKRGHDIELAGMDRTESLTETNLSVHNLRQSNVNPMISNFTSPINLAYASNDNSSRLTFNRR
ncbi:hypothetical protein BDZ97DRAFT_1904814 [Flammula alnicola]|nr:hypothetical protein BDZ97DRAFT_1904814 [Flammula alnicola]